MYIYYFSDLNLYQVGQNIEIHFNFNVLILVNSFEHLAVLGVLFALCYYLGGLIVRCTVILFQRQTLIYFGGFFHGQEAGRPDNHLPFFLSCISLSSELLLKLLKIKMQFLFIFNNEIPNTQVLVLTWYTLKRLPCIIGTHLRVWVSIFIYQLFIQPLLMAD